MYVSAYTSSAFRLVSESAKENMIERQRPGITLRDVRLAIRIEESFSHHFLGGGYALPGSPDLKPEYERPQSMAKINSVQMEKKPKLNTKFTNRAKKLQGPRGATGV